MADIELVIKIPEGVMEYIKNNDCLAVSYIDEVAKAIKNGAPLPEHHGRFDEAIKADHDKRLIEEERIELRRNEERLAENKAMVERYEREQYARLKEKYGSEEQNKADDDREERW